MRSEYQQCDPGDMLERVFMRIQEDGAHTLPVVRNGELVGLLTMDNIGEMLTVSPDLLDRYLSAANKITRLAVGDPSLQLGSATYPVSEYLLQADRMSDGWLAFREGGAGGQGQQ